MGGYLEVDVLGGGAAAEVGARTSLKYPCLLPSVTLSTSQAYRPFTLSLSLFPV
jgi:hypothetical protein